MYDLPPDAPRLRVVVTQLEVWLRRAREALVAAERDEAHQARLDREAAAKRRPAGDWFLTGRPSPGARIWLHQEGCWDIKAGMVPVTREQAIEALTHGGVEPCPACHPARDLGVLE